MTAQTKDSDFNPWPHRLAVALVCATFPLIWVGGLVTTYDAGMAVPDWPSTYGYNLFLYPWTTWIFGPWDLFIEHGHRLLGALVGMITIGLVVAVWRCDQRRWLRNLSLAALVLVIAQGVLGGMRVVLDERTLATIHGCVGPAFFALVAAMAVFTSRLWQTSSDPRTHGGAGMLQRLAVFTAGFAYLQLVVGAHLRHLPVSASPGTFRTIVFFHLILALVIAVHVILLLGVTLLVDQRSRKLLAPAICLAVLVTLQLALGGATWFVNYAWPAGLPEPSFAAGFTILSRGWLQSYVVTAHVAVGSLIIATAVQLACRSLRLLSPVESKSANSVILKGVLA